MRATGYWLSLIHHAVAQPANPGDLDFEYVAGLALISVDPSRARLRILPLWE
jgi:hypothetical protein